MAGSRSEDSANLSRDSAEHLSYSTKMPQDSANSWTFSAEYPFDSAKPLLITFFNAFLS
jgi:hypothetical protein